MPNSAGNSSAPGAPRHRIACVHRADEGRMLAPSVLVRHPDWHWPGHGAGSPGPAKLHKNGFWAPSKNAVRKEGTPHHFNFSLSEMRQYSDSTMVLVLAEDSSPAEEADYPIDIDLDTSALLEEDDDGTLAAYAEAAHSLMRPARHSQRSQGGEDASRGPRRALFYDDMPQQQFADMTIQPRRSQDMERDHGGAAPDRGQNYSSATPDGSFSQNGTGPAPAHHPPAGTREAQLRHEESQNGAAAHERERHGGDERRHARSRRDEEAWERSEDAWEDAAARRGERSGCHAEDDVDDGHPPRPEVTDMRDVHSSSSSSSGSSRSPSRDGAAPERGNGRAPPRHMGAAGEEARPPHSAPRPEPAELQGGDASQIDWRAEVEAAHALGDAIRAAVSADRGEDSDWALQANQAALRSAEAEKGIGRFAAGDPSPASTATGGSGGTVEARGSRDGGTLGTSQSHAAESFERAISHSRTGLAQPRRSGDYATRRQSHSPASPSARRSSRRDAHMQSRVARMDLSNLSVYSLPTLRRLAKDLRLAGVGHLSKPQLVVRLMTEIFVAAKAGGRNEELDAWAVQRTSALSDAAEETRRTRRPRARDLRREVMYRFDDEGSSSDREELARVPQPERLIAKLPEELRREFNEALAAAARRRDRKREAAAAPADLEPREDSSMAAWRAYHGEERGGARPPSSGAVPRRGSRDERGGRGVRAHNGYRGSNGASAHGDHGGDGVYGAERSARPERDARSGAPDTGDAQRGAMHARAASEGNHNGAGFFDAHTSGNGAVAKQEQDRYGHDSRGSGARHGDTRSERRGGDDRIREERHHVSERDHSRNGASAGRDPAQRSHGTDALSYSEARWERRSSRNGASADGERANSRNGAAASTSGAGFFDARPAHHGHNGASASRERAHSSNGATSTGERAHSGNGAPSSNGAAFFDAGHSRPRDQDGSRAGYGRERVHNGHAPRFFEEDDRATRGSSGAAHAAAHASHDHSSNGAGSLHTAYEDRREHGNGVGAVHEAQVQPKRGKGSSTGSGRSSPQRHREAGRGSSNGAPVLERSSGATAHSAAHSGRGVAPRQSSHHAHAPPVAVRSVDIDEDFESLAGLGMEQLQEVCEEVGIAAWSTMRKADMISAILAEAYGIGAEP